MFGIKDKDLEVLGAKAKELFDHFLHERTVETLTIAIAPDHVFMSEGKTKTLTPAPTPTKFEKNTDYFRVVVNELFLIYRRQLWASADPTVFAKTDLVYGGKDISIPCVVGPQALKTAGAEIPTGGKMIIKDKPVAGFYPYKGGDLRTTVILGRLNTDIGVKRIMKLVEAVAGALDYSTQVSAYLKMAGVIISGVEEITGIKDGIKPLLGWDSPFNKPGYFALINPLKGETLNEEELWVVNDALKIGRDQASSQPFRKSDYVLYSVVGTTARDDVEKLPFCETYQKILDDASKNDDASWKRATTDMSTLYMTMYKSPDMTTTHAKKQHDDWLKEIKEIHEKLAGEKPARISAANRKALEESFKVLSLR